MSIASVASLVDLLRDSQLLDAAQLHQVAKDLAAQPDDPRALANLLMLRGWLTSYQVEQVFLGSAQELVLGPYRVLELLGQGGMGQVFKALHTRLNRIVALKIIRQERLSKDSEAVKRFHREAQTAAQLHHPNVVIIYDADQIGDKHFISMEYVDGIDLARLVRQGGPLPVERACDYIRQASLGLQHAHERGMVHRDIKPSNLLVTTPVAAAPPVPRGISGLNRRPLLPRGAREQGGQPSLEELTKTEAAIGPDEGAIVKILDMGLARLIQPADGEWSSNTSLTQEGAVMGTPDYIAPEQARNSHTVDIRADLYSLGCTFYFLLTGRPPFPEGTPIEKLLMHQLDVPRPVEDFRSQVPPGVALVLRKLMAKRPEDRYQAPLEVAEALAPFAASSSVLVQRPQAAALDDNPPSTAVVKVTPAARPRKREIIPRTPSPDQLKTLAKLRGHGGWVMAVSFSPDRNSLASAGVDGSIRMWDFSPDEPREQRLRQAHTGEVHSLAFSPDGKLLASGSGTLDGLIWLWDVTGSQPQERAYLQGHKAPVDALAFSADSKLLASASNDRTVRLWDLTSRELKEWALLKGHTDFVKAVAFSPDGKTVASASQDGTVRLWTVGRLWCKEQAIIKAHTGHVHTVGFSPDGKLLASGSQDMTVRLWDLQGSDPKEITVLEGHKNVVRAIQFPPDGKTLVSVGAGRRVIIWDVATAAKTKEWLLPQAMLCSFAFTFDGRYLATGNSDGSVFVFRLAERRSEE